MCYLQSARSSARFHGVHEDQAGAAPPPWTESLCGQPGSPQGWRIKPTKDQKNTKNLDFYFIFGIMNTFTCPESMLWHLLGFFVGSGTRAENFKTTEQRLRFSGMGISARDVFDV